jgi:5-carboxymethyl-2-hydroxymuconate isomerase
MVILFNLLIYRGTDVPHLTIEYSANLEPGGNIAGLCAALSAGLLESGLFETGAVRVRARPCPHYAIADGLARNGFADMVLRMGKGRSAAERQSVGQALMAVAQAHFATELAAPHFALSLEVVEIGELSWKANAIHPRLRMR